MKLPPEEVHTPKKSWKHTDPPTILYSSGCGGWSVAQGEWEGERVLAIRWNGGGDSPAGYPNFVGKPCWFILPSELEMYVRFACMCLNGGWEWSGKLTKTG